MLLHKFLLQVLLPKIIQTLLPILVQTLLPTGQLYYADKMVDKSLDNQMYDENVSNFGDKEGESAKNCVFQISKEIIL